MFDYLEHMHSALTDTLLARRDNRDLAILVTPARCTTMLGAGLLRYVTDDGWAGVQLDGETRVDELSTATVKVEP